MASMDTKKTLRGPMGVELLLDSAEVFPDDPGNGTPALVYYRGGVGTYWCACEEGEVQASTKMIRLPRKVVSWLENDEIYREVESLFTSH